MIYDGGREERGERREGVIRKGEGGTKGAKGERERERYERRQGRGERVARMGVNDTIEVLRTASSGWRVLALEIMRVNSSLLSLTQSHTTWYNACQRNGGRGRGAV
jgi:hypothetical protein